MRLSWSMRRQLLYYTAGSVLLALLLWGGYELFLTTPPTCFDQAMNGDEHGVDCGGSCSLLCANEARAPVVLWARALQTSPHTYAAAAYVQNNNIGAGARAVRYSFQLLDEQNLLVAHRDGVADLPPVQTIPFVEPNIEVGNRNVTHVLFSFSDVPVWNKVSAPLPALHASEQNLSGDGTRLSATITNDSVRNAAGVTVLGVLFDAAGVARAASKSVMDVAAGVSQEVVFTWASPTPAVRAEITVIPEF